MDGAGPTSEGAEESDALVELLDLIQPWNSQVDPSEIWDHVMKHESKLSWLEPATLEKALEAAHAGEWRLCAYLAARCFKDWKDHGKWELPPQNGDLIGNMMTNQVI
eukprot:s117_g7.t1